MAKLQDVAAKAGVSVTTVSRVINNYGYLGKETVEKVNAAMRELNYLPSAVARSLQGKRTNLVGLIFPGVSNPFFGELVEKLERRFFEKGYKVILCDSMSDREKEREYLRMLAANKVDGIITGTHNANIEEYEATGAAIIAFDRSISKNIPIVSSDNYAGGRMAAETLTRAGAKKIAILTGENNPDYPTYKRYEGCADALSEKGMEAILYKCTQPTVALKTMQLKAILREGAADGYFCTDDLTALLLIGEAKKLFLDVPGDIKVVGYDATAYIRTYHPFLTTIAQPIEDAAILMIDLMLRRIGNPDEAMERLYCLPVSLIRGETA
ncbi:MAG: LacI family DNA-binding transcriptional regulator [Clostridiales Family XIII bacterium]|jgi:LacI family sucrose operon transcriptional repressor|nr:LacI family DNA-binding transcriptional regulator [Clostridiales Family XIII bacterium]